MNIYGKDMKNPSYCRNLSLSLECVSMTKLGGQWNRQLLTGNFFRLYRNDAPGTGVVFNRRRHEILPDAIYVLPPNCNVRTYCENPDARQLYIHFELPRCGCATPLNRIGLDPELRRISDRLIDGITCGRADETIAVAALALWCAPSIIRSSASAPICAKIWRFPMRSTISPGSPGCRSANSAAGSARPPAAPRITI